MFCPHCDEFIPLEVAYKEMGQKLTESRKGRPITEKQREARRRNIEIARAKRLANLQAKKDPYEEWLKQKEEILRQEPKNWHEYDGPQF